MTRYAMVIDTRLCIGCGDCVVACKTENNVPDGLNRDWIVEATQGRYPSLTTEFRSERCNHCSHATCVYACPTGASHYWRDTNIVLVAPERCTGCKACMAACPYDARLIMHPGGYIDKCTFCAHRIERGALPACVETCPSRVRIFGDVSDPHGTLARMLDKRQYRVKNPQTGNGPQLYYLL